VSSCSGPWKVGNVAILMMFNNILWPATPPIQRSGRFRTLWTRNLVAIFLGQDRSRVFSLALRCFQLGKESYIGRSGRYRILRWFYPGYSGFHLK
jgi:hypothetical protein